MDVKLIQIPGVTNHQQLVWQIRVLQIHENRADQAFETYTNLNKSMSSKAEKRSAAQPVVTTAPLPDDIAARFANTRQATPEDLAALEKAAEEFNSNPAILADQSKGLVVEDILRAMEEAGLNRNTLAAKLGKTRQYVGKILDEERRANFTIDTLAELSAALGVKLHVRMLPENERMMFASRPTASRKKTADRKAKAPGIHYLTMQNQLPS